MFDSNIIAKIITTIGAIIIYSFLFDTVLPSGILMFLTLTFFIFLAIYNHLIKDKYLSFILIITVIVHLSVVLFIYYASFQPFGRGGGDFVDYNIRAQYLSSNFRQGNFSDLFAGKDYIAKYDNYFPAIIAFVYTLVGPYMIVGQLFNAWLSVISVILIYFLVIEIGGTKQQAFFTGLISNFYPSHLFFGSLLLKDPLVVALSLAGLLLAIKMVKSFSWSTFLIFYLIIMLPLTHFRFYVSYSLCIAFIFSLLFFSQLNIKKRITYIFIIIIFLGFLPQISGYGYMGIKTFRSYFSFNEIKNFREQVYLSKNSPDTGTEVQSEKIDPVFATGKSSTFKADANFNNPLSFLINYSETFIYSLFGPFPWQIKLKRQLFALFETLPWYILFIFIVKGIIKSIKNYKVILPMLIFSALLLAVLALYTPNYGIITRIRMPAFLTLLCFVPFGFNFENRYINKIKNYLNKKLK